MNSRETALFGLFAALFSVVFCGFLIRVAGQQARLSATQVSSGLAICLAGVAVGLLLVLCVSFLQEAESSWDRWLGALGLVLGGALLCALLVGRRSAPAEPTPRAAAATQAGVALGRGALLLAPGSSR